MLPRNEPPTPKGRYYEIRAKGLREFAGLRRDDERLDPFDLARAAGLLVAPFEQIAPLLTSETREHLLGDGSANWSGGAASHVLPDGRKLIILNPTHGVTRQQATLMEEISHLFYGHEPTRLSIKRKNRNGEVVARDYNDEIEEEAYSTGAAALVPYTALVRMVSSGKTIKEIAKHFGVSPALVEFRIKISKLWDNYASNVFSGNDK